MGSQSHPIPAFAVRSLRLESLLPLSFTYWRAGPSSLIQAASLGSFQKLPTGLASKLQLQEMAGVETAASNLKRRELLDLLLSRMQHLKTIRGHRLPVYCLAFDRSGRWLFTGSDDRIVKVSANILLERHLHGKMPNSQDPWLSFCNPIIALGACLILILQESLNINVEMSSYYSKCI